MSATLDSHLFANYFGGAPALAAGGRTFPVDQFFLEDAHDLIGYHLDAESSVAMRPSRDAKSRRQLEAAAGGRDRQGLLKVPSLLGLKHLFVGKQDIFWEFPMSVCPCVFAKISWS